MLMIFTSPVFSKMNLRRPEKLSIVSQVLGIIKPKYPPFFNNS
jgi:hypothetical protein